MNLNGYLENYIEHILNEGHKVVEKDSLGYWLQSWLEEHNYEDVDLNDLLEDNNKFNGKIEYLMRIDGTYKYSNINDILNRPINSHNIRLYYINTKKENDDILLYQIPNSWKSELFSPNIGRKIGNHGTFKDFCDKNQLQDLLNSYDNIKNKIPADEFKMISSHDKNNEAEKIYLICKECGKSFTVSIRNLIEYEKHQPKSLLLMHLCDNCKKPIMYKNISQRESYFLSDEQFVPEIIRKEWDTTENLKIKNKYGEPSTLENTPKMSDIKVNWICSTCNTSYKVSPAARLWLYNKSGNYSLPISCPQCKRQMSFAQTAVLYYAKQYFKDSVSSEEHDINNISELDIYIPNVNSEDYPNGVSIEYNGGFWHEDKTLKDMKKFYSCLQQGIHPIIIYGDTDKNTKLEVYNDYYIYNFQNIQDFNFILTDIFKNHLGIDSADIDIYRDSTKINKLRVGNEKEKSLGVKYPHLSLNWDYENNYPITPLNRKPTADAKYKYSWVCHICGRQKYSSIPDATKDGDNSTHCQSYKNNYHKYWTNNQELKLLEAQDKYFNGEISQSDFLDILTTTKEEHMAKVQNAYKDTTNNNSK